MKIFIAGGLTAVIVVVVAAVVLLGGGESSLARAAERVDGESYRMTLTMGFVEDGEEFAMAGEAIQNADGTQARLDFKTTLPSGEVLAQEFVSIDDDLWIRGEGISDVLPEGKRWVHSVDPTAMPETMTMSEFVDFLTEADGIDDKGETVVRGKPVTHYQGEVSVREVAENSEGAYAKRVAAALKGEDLVVPLEAWIAEDGRIERMSMRVGDDYSMTADVLEYGVSTASIKAPPKAETIEEAEFDQLIDG